MARSPEEKSFKLVVINLLVDEIYPNPEAIQRARSQTVTHALNGREYRWRREVTDIWCLKNPDSPITKEWRGRGFHYDSEWVTNLTRQCVTCGLPIKQARLWDGFYWLISEWEDDLDIVGLQMCEGEEFEEGHKPRMDEFRRELDAIITRTTPVRLSKDERISRKRFTSATGYGPWRPFVETPRKPIGASRVLTTRCLQVSPSHVLP